VFALRASVVAKNRNASCALSSMQESMEYGLYLQENRQRRQTMKSLENRSTRLFDFTIRAIERTLEGVFGSVMDFGERMLQLKRRLKHLNMSRYDHPTR